MQTLSVLAVEDGAIIVASPAGERFRLPVDAALRARIASPTVQTDDKRLSPREIQAHVRSGLTADQVAAMTGVPVAFIERFVGPVLAERAYIVESALAVRLPPETEGARARTFGAVMGERLDALAAKDVRWSSAKEPSGWILAVAFIADDVQHAARWRFDPKHMRLDADNVEASTLSQQGVPAALTPRLRAIEPTAPVTIVPHRRRHHADSPRRTARRLHAPAPAARRARRPGAAQPSRTARASTAPSSASRRSSRARSRTRSARRSPCPAAHAQPAPPSSRRPTSWTSCSAAAASASPHPSRGPTPHRSPSPGPWTSSSPATSSPRAPCRRTRSRRPAGTPRAAAASVHVLPVRAPQTAPVRIATSGPRPSGRRRRHPRPRGPRRPRRRSRPPSPVPRRGRRSRSATTPAPAPPRQPQEQPPSRCAASRPRRLRGDGSGRPAERRRGADDADAPVPAARPRRGRTSMPSWDEIVFGRDEP